MAVWSDTLAQFEAYLKQSGLERNTVAGYVYDLQRFHLWLAERAGQEVSPAAFASSDVEAYKQYLRNTLDRSPASVNRTLQSVRKFGRFAVMAGVRDSNPAQGVPLLGGAASSAPMTLSQPEVERLVKAAQVRQSRTAVRDCAMLQLLLQTGIRASELIHLRLADVDLGEDHSILTVRGQGRRQERRIPLRPAARRALAAYLDQPRPAGTSHLFLSKGGEPLSIRSVQQIIASLGRAAGLDISAKTLRNTYAGFLWQETGDLGLLTERLGHRRPEAALKYISPLPIAGSTTAGSTTEVPVPGEHSLSAVR